MAAMRRGRRREGRRAVQALKEQFDFLRGEGPLRARPALDGLARIGVGGQRAIFQAQLTSKDPLMRRYAAEGLARSGSAALSLPGVEGVSRARRTRAVALAFAYALESVGRPMVERAGRCPVRAAARGHGGCCT